MSKLPWKTKSGAVTVAGDEILVDFFSTHWVKYIVPAVLYMLIGSTTIFLFLFARTTLDASSFIAHAAFLLGTLLLTIAHHWFFHRILSEGMVDIIITNKRVFFLEDSLWFYDNMREVNVSHIRAVEAHKQGILSNLLRYGTLWFDTRGSNNESSTIRLVPHPHRKAKILTQMFSLK